MISGDHETFEQVIDLVDRWRPEKAYGHERKFQSELQEYLDFNLNEAQTQGGMGIGMGQQRDLPVSTERGKSKADVVVDDVVGIELKRELSNSQIKKLGSGESLYGVGFNRQN